MSIKSVTLLLRESYHKLLASSKLRFLIVGGVGFVVNFFALALLFDFLKVPIQISQFAGAELALLTTFVGNSRWTFQEHVTAAPVMRLLKYHLSAFGGLLLNSGVVINLVHYFSIHYGLALVVGSLVAMIWNYTLYKRFVFRKQVHKKDVA